MIMRRMMWLFLVTAGIVLALVFHLRPRPLLEQATAITAIGDMDNYQWLSEKEILLFRDSAEDLNGGRSTILSRYNLITQVETKLPDLTALYNRGESYAPQVSPDRKWLLWTEGRERFSFDFKIMFVTLGKGNRHYEHSIGVSQVSDHVVGDPVCWTNDGNWIEYSGWFIKSFSDGKVLVRRLNSSEIVRTLPIADSCTFDPFEAQVVGNGFIAPEDAYNSLDYNEYRLGADVSLIRKHSIAARNLSCVFGRAVSCQGDQITWLVEYNAQPPYVKWLHHVLPAFKAPDASTQMRQAIWIKQKDTNQVREIGNVVPRLNVETDLQLRNLQWTPNGKLSFICNGSLYTVPAN